MSLTIGILSWNAHKTLLNTLKSYKLFGLDKLADQKIIFFQQMKKADIEIAENHGYEYIGSPNNIGIAAAYKELVEHTTSDLFLFLENDWLLLEAAKEKITDGETILEMREADVVRYRHRKHHGHPLWTLQFQGCELDHPTHLLDAIHWTESPENFEGIRKGYLQYYYAKATHANWTNNPTMFRTHFLKTYILPRIGTRDAEIDLQEWWEQQDWITVAQGEGLFTHKRIG